MGWARRLLGRDVVMVFPGNIRARTVCEEFRSGLRGAPLERNPPEC